MLTDGLYKRCLHILRECPEFEREDVLRAVFVTNELRLYQDALPTAPNKEQQVNLTINYLLTKHLSDGRPVFPFFIDALRGSKKRGDALYDELGKLYSDVERELSDVNTISVFFVIMAMNQKEVNELITGSVFKDPDLAIVPNELEKFQELKEALQDHGIEDLLSHYKESRDSWMPQQQNAISKIIEEIATRAHRERPDLPLIVPKFFSEEFFSEDPKIHRQAWRQLIDSGGVLVIDAVSSFHPGLRQILLQSGVSSFKQTAILVMSPINPVKIKANQLIEDQIRLRMEEAYARFDDDLDRLCEFGVGNLRTLQRWIFAILEKKIDTAYNQRLYPANRDGIRNGLGDPRGIGKFLYGSGG